MTPDWGIIGALPGGRQTDPAGSRALFAFRFKRPSRHLNRLPGSAAATVIRAFLELAAPLGLTQLSRRSAGAADLYETERARSARRQAITNKAQPQAPTILELEPGPWLPAGAGSISARRFIAHPAQGVLEGTSRPATQRQHARATSGVRSFADFGSLYARGPDQFSRLVKTPGGSAGPAGCSTRPLGDDVDRAQRADDEADLREHDRGC